MLRKTGLRAVVVLQNAYCDWESTDAEIVHT
jgi:hypothetical protein